MDSQRRGTGALEEDEYYIADLIGMKVVLEDGSSFGTLTDVMETGANDVYVVEYVRMEKKFCFLRSRTVFWMWMWKKI